MVLSSVPVIATAVVPCPTSSPEPSATLSTGGLVNTGRFSSWSWDCVTPAPRPAPAIQIGVVTQPAYVPFVTTATTPWLLASSHPNATHILADHLACNRISMLLLLPVWLPIWLAIKLAMSLATHPTATHLGLSKSYRRIGTPPTTAHLACHRTSTVLVPTLRPPIWPAIELPCIASHPTTAHLACHRITLYC